MSKDHVEPPPVPLLDMEELNSWPFFRAVIAEFVATLLFLYVTVATVIGHKKQANQCDGVGLLGISSAFGGMIFVLVYCTAGISGAYINPAVTIGLLVARKVSLARAAVVHGCVMLGRHLRRRVSENFDEALPLHAWRAHDYSKGTALGAKIVGTFLLVYAVFSATDPKSCARDSHVPVPVLAPLPIGFAVFMVLLATIPITHTGINPARSFAAVIYNNDKVWDDQSPGWVATHASTARNHPLSWIFWVEPFIGAVLAAAYHQYVLRASATKGLGSFRINLAT